MRAGKGLDFLYFKETKIKTRSVTKGPWLMISGSSSRLILEVLFRVDGMIMTIQFEMEVRAGCKTGLTGEADQLARVHLHAGANEDLGEVAVT